MLSWLRFTRFYRADPTFSRLSDERCEALAVQARLQRGDAIWLIPGGLAALSGAVLAGFGHLIVSLILTVAGGNGAVPVTAPALAPAGANVNALATVLELMNLTVTLSVMIGVFVLLRRVMLIRSMRRIHNKAVCPFCEFSLVGLFVQHGRVQCPECGQSILLAEHRLSEDDLIPDTPEGLRVMREHWKNQGTDRFGALTGGQPEQNGPRGKHTSAWEHRQPSRGKKA